jgi:type II secretory pathway pseudopilin PulG
VTARDRPVLIVVGLLAVLGGFWFLAISPKRKEAADVTTQLAAAQTRLDTATAAASGAEAAKAKYASDYATVARLGKAVPVDDEVPSLVYQLSHTAHLNDIDFRSIKLTSAGGTAAAAGSSSTVSAALPPGAAVGTAGFPTMPFSFDFDGTFFDMQRFLKSIGGLTSVKGTNIDVKGRLLTVDGVALTAGPSGFPDVTAQVIATSYLLPADEGLTGDGTASSTTPATTTGAAGTSATASIVGSN